MPSTSDDEPQASGATPAALGGHAARHRGANSEDPRLFSAAKVSILREAVADLSWLMERGYAATSAVTIVGDRYSLHARQRMAVARASCGESSLSKRAGSVVAAEALAGQPLLIDGFNLLISIESALSGGVILQCRDGCFRDIASVHGSYRSVEETDRALALIGEKLNRLGPAQVIWVLDQPVSNSGRLRARMIDTAEENGWNGNVELAMSPDKVLMTSSDIAVTSDSTILDNAERWTNIAASIIEEMPGDPWIVDLR